MTSVYAVGAWCTPFGKPAHESCKEFARGLLADACHVNTVGATPYRIATGDSKHYP